MGLCSVSLWNTCMIPQLSLFVKPLFEKFLIFFLCLLGLAFGGFVLLFTLIIIAIISQNATWDFAQNAGGGFVQFAGGGVIAYNRQAGESRRYFLYIAPGVQFGNKKLQKVTIGFL